MLTERDKIAQFKRELRSLNYYKGKIKEITEELIRLARVMHGPKTVKYGERLGGNKINYLELMEQEDACKEELQHYSFLINNIEKRIDCLEKSEKNLLLEIYVNRKKYEELAPEYFASERKLKYDVNEIIRKII